MLRDLLVSLRPEEWTKNLFVLAPLVFAGRLVDASSRARAGILLVAFCLLASSVYLANDIADLSADRLHPVKRRRPLPSGRISVGMAGVASVLLALLGLGLGFAIERDFPAVTGLLAGYLLLNLAYSFVLKHAVVVDALCVAGGFLLRIHAGGAAIGAEVSHWLSLCTLFVSLFLALAKRRAEISLLGEESSGHRAALAQYTPAFLDQLIGWLCACTILSYSIYTVSPETREKFGTDRLWWTVPFVIYGVARYLFLLHRRDGGGNPARTMVRDVPFLVNAALWAAVAIGVIYRAR
ncbi:MAG: decaprenyl-phosphate phosphoribosyltransferase [Planctomycetes bacterium]|nr:decaprenyl-phosphate phosphoribosyltransferase [Planctomycetota bacterium]